MMTTNARPARAAYLDLFKTLLIYGMVSTHVVQLLAARPPRWLVGYTDFINLITFSGFMLAFGLGVGLSTREGRSLVERLTPVLMLLAATYISSLAFVILVDERPLAPALLTDLFSLRVLYGWSEFLASFFTLYLLIALARPLLILLAANVWILAAVVTLCLVATLVTASIDLPLLATLVGTTNYASFPIIPYLPWFLVGIHISRRGGGTNVIEWLLAAWATAAFGWVLVRTGGLPQRFPPSALWIVGAALPLALYLAVSRFTVPRLTIPAFLLAPGRHVLASLVVSNLVIFAIRYIYGKPLRGWLWPLLAGAALLALVTAWSAALDLWRARRQVATAS
jgi:hypothetical protein